MTPSGEMSGQHETTRQQSKAAWRAVAPGWYAQREELWKASRPVSEWIVRRLDPQPGDTVLELAAGLADTGLMVARLVGESGRLIVTDFTPEMVAAARRRARELGVQNAEFRILDAERMDLETDSVEGVLCRWAFASSRLGCSVEMHRKPSSGIMHRMFVVPQGKRIGKEETNVCAREQGPSA
jgi:SAM-dependent methyltransferase